MHLQAAARDPLIRRAPAEAPAARMPRRRRKPSTALPPGHPLESVLVPVNSNLIVSCRLFNQPWLCLISPGASDTLSNVLLEKRINKR